MKLSLVCGTYASCHKAGKTCLALLEKHVINTPLDKNPYLYNKNKVTNKKTCHNRFTLMCSVTRHSILHSEVHPELITIH